tara:strand:+ start:2478 stop:2672 length:195 start_codon:yes stop_codon:yes gene_type:complete
MNHNLQNLDYFWRNNMDPKENDDVHPWQKIMDNDFLLLAFHVGLSVLSFHVWGFIDLMGIPTLK